MRFLWKNKNQLIDDQESQKSTLARLDVLVGFRNLKQSQSRKLSDTILSANFYMQFYSPNITDTNHPSH